MPSSPTVALWLFVGALAASAPPSPRTPVEVEVLPGAVSCAPGDERFDRGFREAFLQERLQLEDSPTSPAQIANAFCFASQRPDERPLRVTVRIGVDGSLIGDYVRPVPDAVRHLVHWRIDVEVPLGGHGSLPARRYRSSAWIRADGPEECETTGRAVALCILEALGQETRHLARGCRLALGPGVSRDRKASNGGLGR